MIKIILIGTERSGMGWVCGILQDLFKFEEKDIKVELLKTPAQIVLDIKNADYKIIGVVRNPRDRIVSIAFWEKYRPDPQISEIVDSSWNASAMEAAIFSNTIQDSNNYQFTIMETGKSTWAAKFPKDYIWTCYHWLLNDIEREIRKILEFLGVVKPDNNIKYAISVNSFEYKTGRNSLVVDITESLRKGCEHVYKEWLYDYASPLRNKPFLLSSLQQYTNYWNIIEHEGHLYNEIDLTE